jgi:hypothetical protein
MVGVELAVGVAGTGVGEGAASVLQPQSKSAEINQEYRKLIIPFEGRFLQTLHCTRGAE